MPLYRITERAGRFVAGHTNTGVGTTIELTERAAAHELRLGTLVPASAPEQVAAEKPKAEATVVEISAAEVPAGGERQDDVPAKPSRKKVKSE